MTEPFLETLWGPIVLAAIAADINFWIYVSIGTNEGDGVGIAFFCAFAVFALFRSPARQTVSRLVAGAGAVAAAAWMILRETGKFDRGYLPPYILFAAAVVAGRAAGRLPRSR